MDAICPQNPSPRSQTESSILHVHFSIKIRIISFSFLSLQQFPKIHFFRQYLCCYILEVDISSPVLIFLTYKLFSWIQFSKRYNKKLIFPNSLKHIQYTYTIYNFIVRYRSQVCVASFQKKVTFQEYYIFSPYSLKKLLIFFL